MMLTRRIERIKRRTTAMIMAMILAFAGIGMIPVDVNASEKKVVKKLSVSKNYLSLEEGENEIVKYKVIATPETNKKVAVKIADKAIVTAKVLKGKIKVIAKSEGVTTVTVVTRAKNKNGKKIAKKIQVVVNSEDDKAVTKKEDSVEEKDEVKKVTEETGKTEKIAEKTGKTEKISEEAGGADKITEEADNVEKDLEESVTAVHEKESVKMDKEIEVPSTELSTAEETENGTPSIETETETSNRKVERVKETVETKEEIIPVITYQAHVQDKGWLNAVKSGETAGTTGQSKRLEGLKITLNDENGKSMIRYNGHVQGTGWQGWKTSGQLSGTEKIAKRLEGIKIELTGDYAKKYDIYYRAHVATFGWLGWAKNGELAGSEGLALRMEAIQIKLVKKGDKFDVGGRHEVIKPKLTYQAHVKNDGWKAEVKEGATAGTTGQSKRMEAVKVNLLNDNGKSAVEYRAHVAANGWLAWKNSGEIAGTTGQGRRMEAIEIKLAGDLANYYDIYYRMHVAEIGWLGWAKNGETAGTTGGGRQAEAIEVKLVCKSVSIDRGGVAYQKLTMQPTEKMVNVNWNLINSVGKQPKGSDACGCYAVAYCRTILDGRVRRWSEFDANGGGNPNNTCASWWSAGYNSNFGGSELEVFQQAVANINAGKPVVVRVHGTRSRGHYVTIIGYTGVTNINNLSAANFLITDPGCGAYGSAENLAGVGYSLQNNGRGYQYCTAK